MGILNLTPDSFSQDGLLPIIHKPTEILKRIKRMVKEGCDLLDIGGESSRPGAQKISAKEEAQRIIPTLKSLVKNFNIPISVDTYKPEVAHAALDCGASIVNNIRGVEPNRRLIQLCRRYDAAIVLMHMRGNPKTMQKKMVYQNLISEIIEELQNSVEICLEMGMELDKIIVDPGLGFAKTAGQNLEIVARLNEFGKLQCPILLGPSRKSFIGRILNKKVEDRLTGTLAVLTASILGGAHLLRVHDVKEAKEIATLTDHILNPRHWTLQ